jgi:hypothetical protein
MEIIIKKIDSHEVDKSPSDIASMFVVMENGKEFSIICKSNHYGLSFSLDGKDGTLHIDRENNTVYRQVVALGGGCGLLIDDEPVEGLSPMAIRGIVVAEDDKGAKEVTISDGPSENNFSQPLILVNGKRKECALIF